jgi:hypothetical protein
MVIWSNFMTLVDIQQLVCMINFSNDMHDYENKKITHRCQQMHMLNTNRMAPCEIVHNIYFAKDEIFMVAYLSIQYGAYLISHSSL